MLFIRRAVNFGRVKINDFYDATFVDDHVAGFQIPMHNPIRVQISKALKYLLHDTFDMLWFQYDRIITAFFANLFLVSVLKN